MGSGGRYACMWWQRRKNQTKIFIARKKLATTKIDEVVWFGKKSTPHTNKTLASGCSCMQQLARCAPAAGDSAPCPPREGASLKIILIIIATIINNQTQVPPRSHPFFSFSITSHDSTSQKKKKTSTHSKNNCKPCRQQRWWSTTTRSIAVRFCPPLPPWCYG